MKFLAFIRLLRPLNLIIIALMMYMIRYVIIGKWIATDPFNFSFALSDQEFGLVVLSTVLLAAAGYIINDYFDMRVDRINKPHQIILGRYIKRRWAMLVHVIFNVTAIGIGLYMALKVGMIELVMIHGFSAISLWFYSVMFKRQFLLGNMVIGILASLTPIMVAVFEIPLLIQKYSGEVIELYNAYQVKADPADFFYALYYIIFTYAAFAFVTTLIREIQKDIADIGGDKAIGCNTVPIALGTKGAKAVVSVLILATVGALYYTEQLIRTNFETDTASFWYFTFALVLPLLVSMTMTLTAHNRKRHLWASQVMKLTMVAAILFPLVIALY